MTIKRKEYIQKVGSCMKTPIIALNINMSHNINITKFLSVDIITSDYKFKHHVNKIAHNIKF